MVSKIWGKQEQMRSEAEESEKYAVARWSGRMWCAGGQANKGYSLSLWCVWLYGKKTTL